MRRLAATVIDGVLGVFLGFALSYTPVGYFFATRAVVMLRIGAEHTVWKGPIPMMMGILGTFVYGLPFALLVVLLTEPLLGASPGKKLTGLTIVSRGDTAVSRAQLWRRELIKTSPWWGLTAALLTGSWVMAVISSAAAVLLALNMALSTFTSIRPVHDARSATRVERRDRK